MKNKKNIYILLPAVLLIWGGVMYQFFSFSGSDEVQVSASTGFTLKPFKIKERDTVPINVNYRDPFLGKMYTSNGNGIDGKKTSGKKKKSVKIADPIVWPEIAYKGIVSDTKNKNRVFMIIINGRTFLMNVGSMENDVLLKEGNRESVYVKYKGELNLIFLQE